MFQTVFQSIIRSSKLHIHRQVFVRPILLPAASCRLKHVERLTEINKLKNVASCWLYCQYSLHFEPSRTLLACQITVRQLVGWSVNDKLDMTLQEAVVAYFQLNHWMFLQQLRKTKPHFSEQSRCPCRHSDLALPCFSEKCRCLF